MRVESHLHLIGKELKQIYITRLPLLSGLRIVGHLLCILEDMKMVWSL